MFDDDKPPLDEDTLAHFGVKGMKWGVRKHELPGVPRSTNHAARKDAVEFARAKMFYGEGAGTRRKLIKAKVEAASKRDPKYKQAFDHHLAQQDLGQHAAKARGERKRKDVKSGVGKQARSLNRAINGPFAGTAMVGLAVAGATAAKKYGLDVKLKQAMNDQKLRNAGADFLKNMNLG